MATELRPAGAERADPYLDLIRAFPLRPIRTDADHDRAIAIVDALSDRRPAILPEEHDYFIVLCLLIEHYESKIYPEPAPGP